jgi:hypothetical protein
VFFVGSRYVGAGTYRVETASGPVVCTRLPLPRRDLPLRGYHRRLDGQRPDLVANFYLKDATASWRLCDASGTIAPDALAARELVAVPGSGNGSGTGGGR